MHRPPGVPVDGREGQSPIFGQLTSLRSLTVAVLNGGLRRELAQEPYRGSMCEEGLRGESRPVRP